VPVPLPTVAAAKKRRQTRQAGGADAT
jgi:hypothetical protein